MIGGPAEGLYALALVEGSCLSAESGRAVEIQTLPGGLGVSRKKLPEAEEGGARRRGGGLY